MFFLSLFVTRGTPVAVYFAFVRDEHHHGRRQTATTELSIPLLANQCPHASETLLRPVFVAIVVFSDSGPARRQDHPRLLRYREDMDIRRQAIWVIQRADANEIYNIAGARIVAPQSDMTRRTARDLLSLAAIRGRPYNVWRASQKNNAVSFDHRIKGERSARLTLAPAAIAAVNKKRLTGHAVAYGATRASTIPSRSRPLGPHPFTHLARCSAARALLHDASTLRRQSRACSGRPRYMVDKPISL
jgi:hypothetical protein